MLRSYLDGAVFGTTAGDGPVRALLLHGWRRSSEDFAGVAAALADGGLSSLSVDLPGFGASPAPSEPMGARGYATLLAPLVEGLADGTGAPVVVGHSFGARVSVCLAAARPDLVAGLVLTGAPLVRGELPRGRPSPAYRAIRAAARLGLVSDGRLEAARRRHGSADYRAATGVVRDVLVRTVTESYDDELRALRCPVALVWGAEDTAAPLRVARAIDAMVPQATLEVLEGVGHLVPTEAPGALVAATATLVAGGVR